MARPAGNVAQRACIAGQAGGDARCRHAQAFGQQAPSKGKRSAAAGAASRGTKATGSAASAGNKTTAAAAGGNAAGGGGGAKATTSSTTAAAGATGGKTAVPSRLRPDAPEFRSPSKVGGGGGGAAGSPARAPAGGEGEDGSRASKRLKLEEGNGNDNHHSSKGARLLLSLASRQRLVCGPQKGATWRRVCGGRERSRGRRAHAPCCCAYG